MGWNEAGPGEPLDGERGSTIARVLAVAALVVAVALVALAMFGQGETYRVKAVFENAGQLVPGNQVRVSGQPIGTVTEIELDESAQAVITMEIRADLAPLHEGTKAAIRATSLSGIANRYVSLAPGPNNAKEMADGGLIGADDTSAAVDLDVLFNTLDGKHTRQGLRNLIRGSATQYDARGPEAAESVKYFAPFLSSTTRLTAELALDQGVLERFVKDGATTVSALAERRDDLAGLVTNTNRAFGAIASESSSPSAHARVAAEHLPQGQHHLRQPAGDARRPGAAGGGVEAGHQGPRTVPAPAAAARGGGSADDRRPAHADPSARAPTTT